MLDQRRSARSVAAHLAPRAWRGGLQARADRAPARDGSGSVARLCAARDRRPQPQLGGRAEARHGRSGGDQRSQPREPRGLRRRHLRLRGQGPRRDGGGAGRARPDRCRGAAVLPECGPDAASRALCGGAAVGRSLPARPAAAGDPAGRRRTSVDRVVAGQSRDRGGSRPRVPPRPSRILGAGLDHGRDDRADTRPAPRSGARSRHARRLRLRPRRACGRPRPLVEAHAVRRIPPRCRF